MTAGRSIRHVVPVLVLLLVVAPVGLSAAGSTGTVSPDRAPRQSESPALSTRASVPVVNNSTPTEPATTTGKAFSIVAVTASARRVGVGDPYTVEVTVENVGTERAAKTIEFEADYVQVASRSVRLSPGQRTTVSFTHTFTEPGTGAVQVDHRLAWNVSVYQTRFPDIAITGIAANETVVQGRPYTVGVTVANRGNASGTKTIEFEADYRVVANRTVALAPGEERTIRFGYRFAEPGNETVKIDHTYARNLTVEPAIPAFTVVGARLVDDRIRPGEPARVVATVANTGEADGRYTVELELYGEVVDVQTVSVPMGERERVVFSRRISRPGQYTIGVGNHTLPLRVIAPADGTPSAVTRPDTPGVQTGNFLTLFGLPLATLVAVPIALVVLVLVTVTSIRYP